MGYNNRNNKTYKKYNNVEKIIDGIKFDSLTEAGYYEYLKEQKLKGKVISFEVNKTFTLQEGYAIEPFEIEGQPISRRKASSIKYIADFVVLFSDGKMYIIDTKGGATTEAFKLKKKLFEKQFNIPIVEARKTGGKWVYS